MATVDSVVLNARKREADGSGAARRVRMEGLVPVVIYGEGRNETLQVNAHDFALMLKRHGEHQILDLVVEGAAPVKVLVKEVQHHVVDGRIMHADLVAVSMDKPISLSLPLKLEGEAIGLKSGGVLELVINEVEVECLPGDVVEEIEVDVSGLEVGDNMTMGQITLPKGLTLLTDEDVVFVTIAHPTLETSADDAEAEGEKTAAEQKEKEE